MALASVEGRSPMPSPELREFVRSLLAFKAAGTAAPPLVAWREGYEIFGRRYPSEAGVTVEPVDAGGVRAAWIAARGADPGRTILYLHGGGYTLGSIATHIAITSRLAGAAKARVLALDYRLAPEHRFPAAADDCLRAWRWLLDRGQDPGRAAFAGDSAGGGLVLATMMGARDAGLPLPACGVPISPWVDLDGRGAWREADDAVDPMVSIAELDRHIAEYLVGGDPRDPRASPLLGDLAGLPPLLIQVGEAEILLADATRLAERARAAGVGVTLEIEPEAPHVWHHAAPTVPEALAAIRRIGAFVLVHAR
jgi:acetyl esterase/lipase